MVTRGKYRRMGLGIRCCVLAVGCAGWPVAHAAAATSVFFNSNQVATLVATGATWDTISSDGYEFTYSRDKLFTGGISGDPTGRYVRVDWPEGVEAQAVTAGPNPGKAQITIRRTDGGAFSLAVITFKLLANTAGAGGTLEMMPQANGEDALGDPLFFDATGIAGNTFTYDATPNYLGSTAALTNYEAYKIGLYVDYALTALTLDDPRPPSNHPPAGIALDPAAILENEPLGTVVGLLTTSDPDAGDFFSYALAVGASDSDNGIFSITGDNLLAEASFNYEVQSNYSIRVETRDSGGLATQQIFSIQVLDMAEPPPAFLEPVKWTPAGAVLFWNNLPNHTYILYRSPDMTSGFTAVQSILPSPLAIGSYTDATPPEASGFWKLTTGP